MILEKARVPNASQYASQARSLVTDLYPTPGRSKRCTSVAEPSCQAERPSKPLLPNSGREPALTILLIRLFSASSMTIDPSRY